MSITKPFTFVSGTYAKSAEVNADFDAAYSQINTNISNITKNANEIINLGNAKANINGNSSEVFNVANPVNNSNAVNLATLKAMYPVGSIYIGTMETCPLASLFGSWSKVSEGRVLWGSDSDHAAGNTIAAGLPNITASSFYFEGGTVGNHGAIRTPKTGNGSDGSSGVYSDSLQFNASWSNSIYGNSETVQPPAYVVNIWRRTE